MFIYVKKYDKCIWKIIKRNGPVKLCECIKLYIYYTYCIRKMIIVQ